MVLLTGEIPAASAGMTDLWAPGMTELWARGWREREVGMTEEGVGAMERGVVLLTARYPRQARV